MGRNALNIKLRRELWQLRGQVVAIALVIAGGVAVCVMSVLNYSSLMETRAQYYEQHRFAEVFAAVKRAPRHVLQEISKIPGVARAEGRVEEALWQDRFDGFEEALVEREVFVDEEPEDVEERAGDDRGRRVQVGVGDRCGAGERREVGLGGNRRTSPTIAMIVAAATRPIPSTRC